MDIKRVIALTLDIIRPFFEEFSRLKEEYNVGLDKIYNMDETGFQMGQNHGDYVIYDRTVGPPIVPTTGITQWVTAIECISATGRVIKPLIIHVGQEPEIDWWPPVERVPNWVWGFSSNGWIDNQLALDWLRKCFIKETSEVSEAENHRILVLDGHKSHTSGLFQWECFQHHIHLIYLPAHASHKL